MSEPQRAVILHSAKCKTPSVPGGKCYCDARELRNHQNMGAPGGAKHEAEGLSGGHNGTPANDPGYTLSAEGSIPSRPPKPGEVIAVRAILDWAGAGGNPVTVTIGDGGYGATTDAFIPAREIAPWRSAEWIAAAERLIGAVSWECTHQECAGTSVHTIPSVLKNMSAWKAQGQDIEDALAAVRSASNTENK